MPSISTDSLLAALRNSNIVEPAVMEKIEAESGSKPAKQLASELVANQTLTVWQAKFLLSGRHQLRIGSYILLNRVERDRLGDRFEAIHEQLDRKVDLQILPGEFSNQDEMLKGFLKQATNAANIDHPHITHVYDIDQTKGRYFLVVEHVDGKSLDEIEGLEFQAFCKSIQQSLHGLNFAHKRDVVHGSVSAENIIVTEDGQTKVSNIAISTLIRKLDAEEDRAIQIVYQPEDDLRDLGTTALKMLQDRYASSDDLSRNKLVAIFKQLAAVKSAVAEAATITSNLDSWIENRFPTKRQQVSQGNAAVSPGPATETSASQTVGDSIAQHPLRVPIMISTIVCTVIISGFIGYFGYKLIAGDGTKTQKPGVEFENRMDALPDSDLKVARNDQQPSLLPDSELKVPDKDQGQDDKDLDLTDENKKNNTVANTNVENPAKNETKPGETAPQAVVDENKKSEPEKVPQQPDSGSPAVVENNPTPKPPVEANKPPVVTEESPVVAKEPPQPVGDPNKPFELIPASVNLPALTKESVDASVRKIGEVTLGKSLLGMTLISPASIIKQKYEYQLKRSADDNQRWLATVKKPRIERSPIAEFWLDGRNLNFQWNELAGGDFHEASNLFRNSIITLQTASESTHLVLREPMHQNAPLIDEENADARIDFEIESMPRADLIITEISEIKHESEDKDFAFVYFPDSLVVGDRRNPLHVFFTVKETARFTWLEVESKIGNRSQLAVDLKIRNNPKARTYKTKYYDTFESNVVRVRDQLSNAYTVMNNTVAPDGKKGEHAKNTKTVKEQLDAANLFVDEVRQQKKNLANIMNKRIQARVYVNLEGHEIDLVRFQPPPTQTPPVQEAVAETK